MNPKRRSTSFKLFSLAAVSWLTLTTVAAAQQTQVRWGQWKGTEVGIDFMTEVEEAFEADHPEIDLVIVDSPFQGFHDRAIVLHQANQLPDVLMAQVDWVAEFADLGLIAPLDDFIANEPEEFMGNIPETFHTKWRGNQYYVPVESGAVAMFYNTDIFEAAGVDGPPTTWEEFAETARQVTDPTRMVFAVTATLASEPPTNMTYDIYPLILQAGGTIIDPETNRAAFNSEAGVRAIEWYVERINDDNIAMPGVLSNGEREKRANFASGNVAMMFEGPWGIAIQRQLNPDLNYGIAPLPEGETTGTMVRGSLNTMTTQAADPEAAWTFMKWLSGPEGNEIWARGTGSFPARTDVSDQDWFKERELFQAFVTQMERPNAVSPFLVMPNAVQMNKIMTTEVQHVVQGNKSAEQALDDAAEQWNEIFAAAD
jgi:multiple sugar transport system substrate-binding protein